MVFDFRKIKPKRKEALPVDPIDLFQKLKVSDPNINDLWLAQGDTLREWHRNREKPDIGVVLNTGAGKTLVGLLIAQSLVNETKGKVVYACSSIQLIDQTAEKAEGYGLYVTTYYRGEYSNDLFTRGEAPCVTTYQALFNGRSVFFKQDLVGLVFDDAHTAEHLLRDHFSLRVSRDDLSDAYTAIVGLFRPYHQQIGKAGSYNELGDPKCQRLFLVPPFEVHRMHAELLRILQSASLGENQETMFAWEYLQDRIDLCCVLLSRAEVTITPAFVPVSSLPYFGNNLRRVYLSATLSAPDSFTRTFGRVPDAVIAPSTTAGECERLLTVPSRFKSKQEDTDIAATLISRHKALILVPNYARANKWQKIAKLPPRDKVSEHVHAFKNSSSTPKLILAARYDGVDLPGDTCRVMVIDDLPIGVGPLERFMWEYLNLSNTLRTAVASRIIQSFGRISRGMSDHGVVFLTGKRLVDWLLVPRNAATLPPFLQKQIALGFEVSTQAKTVSNLGAAADQCLKRDKGWIQAYDEYIRGAESEKAQEDTERLTKVAKSEAMFGVLFWKRDYNGAAKCLSHTLEDAFDLSRSTGAWHSLWLGRALELLGDRDSAQELYIRAHANQPNIPAYPTASGDDEREEIPNQIIEVVRQMKIASDGTITLPKTIHVDLSVLDGKSSPAQIEESLRALGQYLGLESSRPDKEFGTGPDVLWKSGDLPALCIEVKSDKKPDSQYQKNEIGQLTDHVQWVKDNTNAGVIIPMFVGPLVGATPSANPSKDICVTSLEQFRLIAGRLIAALDDAAKISLSLTLRVDLHKIFKERGLLWKECLQKIEHHRLRELKQVLV